MNSRITILIICIVTVASKRCVIQNSSTKEDLLSEATAVLRETDDCEALVFENINGDLDIDFLHSFPANVTEIEVSKSNITHTNLCSYPKLRKISILDNTVFPVLDQSITAQCDNIVVMVLSNVTLHPSAFIYMNELQVLDMRCMKIDYFSHRYVRPLHNLRFLRIFNSEINEIESEVLCPPTLRRLNLKANRLFPNITISLMDSCFNLESLVLYGNYHIDDDAFNTMAKLKKLYIIETKIDYLSENVFRALSGLVLLHLEENRIKEVHEDAFVSLINLEMLNLKYSAIEVIKPGTFRNLEKLEVLSLTGNKLTTLSEINHLPSLKKLDVSWNRISEIDVEEVRDNLPSLNQLIIFGNTMTCEYVSHLKNQFETNRRRINVGVTVVNSAINCL